jgi:outer membrane biosynthesis protein TonB
MNRTLAAAVLCLVALTALAWADDEILPGKKGRIRDSREQDNPMYDVANDMGLAARRLGEGKTDDTTQDVQEKIIEKLDKLIEQARKESEKQPQGGKGDSKQRKPEPKPQPKPSPEEQQKEAERQKQEKKPMTAEEKKKSERPGIGRPGEGEPSGKMQTDAEEWGNLPPAIRDQLLQSQGEGFPLKYRELLRRYYLELSKPRE